MNLPAFDSLDAGRRWLASFKTSDNIKEHIACDFCRKIHIDCFPSEVSGMSSGKSVRHEQHVSIFDR